MKADETEIERVVGTNRKAAFKYHLLNRYEAGIALRGSEVKSLREGQIGFEDAHAVVRNGELYLRSLHIAGYDKARAGGHDPVADRKLLMKRHEIKKIESRIMDKGMTVIPTRIYFKNGWAKVELALATGKRKYDKRRAIQERDEKREMERFQKQKKQWTG